MSDFDRFNVATVVFGCVIGLLSVFGLISHVHTQDVRKSERHHELRVKEIETKTAACTHIEDETQRIICIHDVVVAPS